MDGIALLGDVVIRFLGHGESWVEHVKFHLATIGDVVRQTFDMVVGYGGIYQRVRCPYRNKVIVFVALDCPISQNCREVA